MCTPALAIGIATGVMGAVQSIAGYSAEQQAARESERAYQEQRTLNAEAANRSYQQSQAQLKGEYDKASQKAEELLVQRLQAQGTTLAAGRAGQSVGGLLTDAQRTEWMEWGVAYIRKKKRWSKKLAEREMAFIDLYCGLKSSDHTL